jgi:hypothetical protein
LSSTSVGDVRWYVSEIEKRRNEQGEGDSLTSARLKMSEPVITASPEHIHKSAQQENLRVRPPWQKSRPSTGERDSTHDRSSRLFGSVPIPHVSSRSLLSRHTLHDPTHSSSSPTRPHSTRSDSSLPPIPVHPDDPKKSVSSQLTSPASGGTSAPSLSQLISSRRY